MGSRSSRPENSLGRATAGRAQFRGGGAGRYHGRLYRQIMRNLASEMRSGSARRGGALPDAPVRSLPDPLPDNAVLSFSFCCSR